MLFQSSGHRRRNHRHRSWNFFGKRILFFRLNRISSSLGEADDDDDDDSGEKHGNIAEESTLVCTPI